jgi:DNA-binding NtrC family response regulator
VEENLNKARRILIVDDEASNRSLLLKIFARAGFEVRTAMNAPQAMAFLASEPFDALLSDVTMPSMPPMDGHDLARWAARNHSTVRCVLMTAMDVECEDCPFVSGCKMLAKPFTPQDAVAIIQQILAEPLDKPASE